MWGTDLSFLGTLCWICSTLQKRHQERCLFLESSHLKVSILTSRLKRINLCFPVSEISETDSLGDAKDDGKYMTTERARIPSCVSGT